MLLQHRYFSYLAAIGVFFFLIVSALVYNSLSLHQKLEVVNEEISNPIFEQNILITRIRFLCNSIQNSHYKILTYMAQDRRDLLESEIVSLKELTAVRIQELEKLQSVIDKNMKKETAPYLFTQNLERKITDLDLKQAEFIHEVELAQKVKTTDATALLSEEWNDLHQQVIDTETAFLLHNQKENEEARQLVEIIKNNSLENMYFTLVVGLLLLLLLLLLLNQNNGQK